MQSRDLQATADMTGRVDFKAYRLDEAVDLLRNRKSWSYNSEW